MKDYVPQNKFDEKAIACLQSLPFEAVRNDVWELLEWLQDMNWPVAYDVAVYLAPHVNEIKDDLIKIFNTDDTLWQMWIICGLIGRSPIKPDAELLTIIRRIAEHPTKIEIEEEVDLVAKDVLEQFGGGA
ncbi:uncharacterized protein DUF5071 [Mucilaginibacter yixingensis]|uniref:Uncharacterized protein DUF5071 n=1 Tax=Mucilaginibacter yixingensis TaxID=1295612 RepID=A0A2T5JDL5_9SPHI|nr:DUF5071 domain-containing protein [Mucilaginibacter yixingensis]PTQ99860.1 uncharacterized protein DUF5071 [Mucilaginibacter yixingensis]